MSRGGWVRRGLRVHARDRRDLPEEGGRLQLHVVETWPYPGYVQIGTVKWDRPFHAQYQPPTSLEVFYGMIQQQVCEAGGEVVIAQANGLGMYVYGIVLRRADAPAGTWPPPPPR